MRRLIGKSLEHDRERLRPLTSNITLNSLRDSNQGDISLTHQSAIA
jgi:hypothetical protein